MDQPRAVIADIRDLSVSAAPTLSVFTAVWLRVGDWPGVPILVVADPIRQRTLLAASSIRRFLPIYDTVDAAVAGADLPPRPPLQVQRLEDPAGRPWQSPASTASQV